MSTGKPNWAHWKNLALVPLEDAVTLSLDLVGEPGKANPHRQQFDDRIAIATNYVNAGKLHARTKAGGAFNPATYQVKLTEFRAWGEALPEPFSFPEEFPRAPPAAPDSSEPVATRWPWGNYETDLLRKLAAAADKFWKLYDPADASTAPTNDVVVAWLKLQGVADRNAQVMATILRARDLPTGPRK